MGRVKTFINGGSLLPTDLNDIQDDYETAFSTWKQLAWFSGTPESQGTNSAWGGPYQTAADLWGGATVRALAGFYLDPAYFAAGARGAKLRLVFTGWQSSATAPALAYTLALAAVNAADGKVGTTTGNTAAFTVSATATLYQAVSTEFACPAAGHYCFKLSTTTTTANGVTRLTAALQLRQA